MTRPSVVSTRGGTHPRAAGEEVVSEPIAEERVEAASTSAHESREPRAGRVDALPAVPDDAGPAERAFVEHAREAEPLLRSSARVLQHAEPPVYADLALGLADRLAAVSWTTTASVRQELIVEERQLIEHLGARYKGLTELEDILAEVDESLHAVQSMDVEPVASPDPRTRSARGAELLDAE